MTRYIFRALVFSIVIVLVTVGLFYSNIPQVVKDYISDPHTDFLVESKIDSSQLENIGLKDSLPEESISGVILLSAIPQNGTTTPMQTYSFTMQDSVPVFMNQSEIFNVTSSNSIEVDDVNNPTKLFFNALTFYEEKEERIPEYILYQFDSVTASLERVPIADGLQSEVMTWSSNTERLAYAVIREDGQESHAGISNWDIVVYDTLENGEVARIKGALHPEWSPDGERLVYLKRDGVYIYDMETALEQQVKTLKSGHPSGGLHGATMLAVSPDGKYLILTLEGRGRIEVYSIDSWEIFEPEFVGRIVSKDHTYAWPIFSPDSKFYAVRTLDVDRAAETFTNQRIEIRTVQGRDVVFSVLVDQFALGVVVDDWIVKLPGS